VPGKTAGITHEIVAPPAMARWIELEVSDRAERFAGLAKEVFCQEICLSKMRETRARSTKATFQPWQTHRGHHAASAIFSRMWDWSPSICSWIWSGQEM